MKHTAQYLSAFIILWIVFYALSIISRDNQFTSVRKYLQQEQVTDTWTIEEIPIVEVAEDTEPPIIEITNYTNGQVVTEASIDIQVQVTDNTTSSESITIEGNGIRELKDGYNPIVVSATDEAGNVSASYIIVEKK